MTFRKLLAAVLILPASQAIATGKIENLITAADKERLQNYDSTRIEAIAEAKAGGTSRDTAAFGSILAEAPIAFDDFDMTGTWECRTIKAGGVSPLIIYGWFTCRVTDDGSGWALEKISGSQRTTGRFYTDSGKRLTYIGSFFVAGEKPKPYGSGPESDQVGYTFRTGPKEWRIEFPAPHYESKLDILEFRR